MCTVLVCSGSVLTNHYRLKAAVAVCAAARVRGVPHRRVLEGVPHAP